jgi:hypothetical protein
VCHGRFGVLLAPSSGTIRCAGLPRSARHCRRALSSFLVAVTFTDQDSAFERWRDRHPQGFIVNHARVPGPAYAVLHRADCVRLRVSRGANWTSTYGKTCGDTLEDVRIWARQTIGTLDLHRCHFCQPPGPQSS